jgi:hypothetical protein
MRPGMCADTICEYPSHDDTFVRLGFRLAGRGVFLDFG